MLKIRSEAILPELVTGSKAMVRRTRPGLPFMSQGGDLKPEICTQPCWMNSVTDRISLRS